MRPFLSCLALCLLASILPREASAACPACPGGYTEVSLALLPDEVTSSKTLWIVEKTSIERRKPPEARKLPSVIYSLENINQLESAFAELARGCKRARYVYIGMHGADGRIMLDRGLDLAPATAGLFLANASCAIADHARIEVMSCNTGRGCQGENFMQMLAFYLLARGGGTLMAFTSYGIAIPTLTPYFSSNLTEQEIHVAATGSRPLVLWERSPKSDDECTADLRNKIRQLERLRTRLYSCDLNLRQLMKLDNEVNEELETDREVLAYAEANGFSRQQLDPELFPFYTDYGYAISGLEAKLERWGNFNDCATNFEKPSLLQMKATRPL